jgi:transposase
MNEMTNWVGIDVSKRKLDVALLTHGKLRHKCVANTPAGFEQLAAWLVAHTPGPRSVHVCLEATGPYSEALATALADGDWMVSVVNPARIAGFAQSELARNKTDRADAALLARFCMALRPVRWSAPPRAQRELRAWTERLQTLKDARQQELNRQEAALTSGQHALWAHMQKHVEWLEREIAQLQREIDDHIDRHPDLKRDAQLLGTIPGIGPVSTPKLLAYMGDLERFRGAKAFAAFTGTTPRQRLSGSSVRGRTMMSRTGHRELRLALYMPGLVARRHNPVLRAFADRLAARGMAPKAVIGAVMRKLAHMIYGVLTSGKPFNPDMGRSRLDFQDGI